MIPLANTSSLTNDAPVVKLVDTLVLEASARA